MRLPVCSRETAYWEDRDPTAQDSCQTTTPRDKLVQTEVNVDLYILPGLKFRGLWPGRLADA